VRKLMVEQRKRVEELITSIKEETNGYKLGKPWRHSDKSLTCVVPILKATKDHEREYITITEAKNISIIDTGNINEARVKNEEDKPVFLRLGEILAGGTQERAVTSSRIVFPGTEITIPIVCIHASKGIQKDAVFHFSGYAPNKDYSYIYNTHNFGEANQQESWNLDRTFTSYADSVLGKHGYKITTDWQQVHGQGGQGGHSSSSTPSHSPSISSGQIEAWTNDGTTSSPDFTSHIGSGDIYTQNIGYYQVIDSVVGSNDDLTSKHKEVNELLEDIIKKVPLFEDQVGLALIDPDGFKCLDCYDVKLSYKAIKEALVGKETAAISDTDEENVFEYKPDVARKAINKVLDNQFEENVVHEDGKAKTITLDLEGYMGEAVLLNNKVIHLVITRKE